MAKFEICYGSGPFENLINRLTTDNSMSIGIALQHISLCNYYMTTFPSEYEGRRIIHYHYKMRLRITDLAKTMNQCIMFHAGALKSHVR